jgi:hypothetical protein
VGYSIRRTGDDDSSRVGPESVRTDGEIGLGPIVG